MEATQRGALRVATAAHVATVTLDRPPVNALDDDTMDEIITTFDALGADPGVRAIVLTGAGRVFCAGADIRVRADADRDGPAAHNRLAREMLCAVLDCPVPVVAAVNGAALGGGLSLVASADLVVAAESAVFGLPELDVGLLGGTRHAMRLVGNQRTRWMLLCGTRYSAAELHAAGQIGRCVPASDLLPVAQEVARGIAGKSPTGVRLGKKAMNEVEAMALREGYRHEQTYTDVLRGHPDSDEAMRAFREHRPAVFGE